MRRSAAGSTVGKGGFWSAEPPGASTRALTLVDASLAPLAQLALKVACVAASEPAGRSRNIESTKKSTNEPYMASAVGLHAGCGDSAPANHASIPIVRQKAEVFRLRANLVTASVGSQRRVKRCAAYSSTMPA